MERTIRQLRGFVRVHCLCPYPERFINLCAQNDVMFWGVKRMGENELEVVLDAGSYPKAVGLAAANHCQLNPVEKRGAPFFLLRMRRRWVLAAGLLVCALILFTSNQYIWEMKVEGNVTVSDDAILQALDEIGIGLGTKSSSIDIADVQNKILQRVDALSWITVNAKGSVATVVVRERVEKPYIVPQKSPANIIAAKSGLIVSMDTLAGAPQVFPGQMVKEGQLLVSGLMDSKKLGARFVHARAGVMARTWYEMTAVIPLRFTGKHYTGRSKSHSALVAAGNRINLYNESSQPYTHCDKIVETTALRLPTGTVLPLTLVTETFAEFEPTDFTLDMAVAESLLRHALDEALEAEAGDGEVVNMDIRFTHTEDAVTAHMTAECLEQISRQIPIPTANDPYPQAGSAAGLNPYLPDWIYDSVGR